MKKIVQFFAFVIVIALGRLGGWKIMHTPKQVAAGEDGHGHGGSGASTRHIHQTSAS